MSLSSFKTANEHINIVFFLIFRPFPSFFLDKNMSIYNSYFNWSWLHHVPPAQTLHFYYPKAKKKTNRDWNTMIHFQIWVTLET